MFGKTNRHKGVPHTEEWKKMMSEARTGVKRPDLLGKGGPKGKHWKLVDGKRIYY